MALNEPVGAAEALTESKSAKNKDQVFIYNLQTKNIVTNHGPVSNVSSNPMALQAPHQPIAHACSSERLAVLILVSL
jgi:hypothetical protein